MTCNIILPRPSYQPSLIRPVSAFFSQSAPARSLIPGFSLLPLLAAFLVISFISSSPLLASEESERRQALKAAFLDLKTEFETRTGRLKDPDQLMLEGLKTTALAWTLAAENLAGQDGDEAAEDDLARARAAFDKTWANDNRAENRLLAASELYYQALLLLAVLSAKEQNNLTALAYLNNGAEEVKAELENSTYAQRKSAIYINALALTVMPVLVKLKAGPETQKRLDRETDQTLQETEALVSRTDVHLRGKFFLLYASSVRLLLKSSFLLAEDPNLGLAGELAPIKEIWQNYGADQNDPAGLAVSVGALTLTSLPLAYGLASR